MAITAALCPGQGSQRVGMGVDLVARFPDVAGPLFSEADDVLGFSLSRLCFDGPVERLRQTDVTQPAVFVTSLALYEVVRNQLPAFDLTAGHSLGEYTALTIAGVLRWTDALVLVARRGELMAAANRQTPGTMLAVLGVKADTVEKACAAARAASGEVIEVANYNDDTQTVVSGTKAGAAAFQEVMSRTGLSGLRIVPLDVGAPFHSSLMQDVESEFSPALDDVRFEDPRIPVITGVDARAVTTGAAAKESLKRQLVGAVQWRKTMATMVGRGVDTFVEIGPGRVLSGLCRSAYPDAAVHSVSDARRADKVVQDLAPADQSPGAAVWEPADRTSAASV